MSGERWACVVIDHGDRPTLATSKGRLLVATTEQERAVLAFGQLVLLPESSFTLEITVTRWLAGAGYRADDKANDLKVEPSRIAPLAEAKPAESSEDRW